MASTIYIPNIVYWSSFFSPTSQRLVCLVCVNSFWWKPFWQVWSDISLWYWFVFPWWLMILRIFSWVCWVSVCLLQKKYMYSGPLLIFFFYWIWWLFVFLILSTLRFFSIFWILKYTTGYLVSDIRHIIYKYLFPIGRLPFCFVNGFLCCVKAFICYSPICLILLLLPLLEETDAKKHC